MMNLFSVFDPTSYFGFSLNWLIMLMVFMFFPGRYFFVKSSYMNVMSLFFNEVKQMFNEVAKPNHSVLVFMSVITFLYLMISNLLGLFPFIFFYDCSFNNYFSFWRVYVWYHECMCLVSFYSEFIEL